MLPGKQARRAGIEERQIDFRGGGPMMHCLPSANWQQFINMKNGFNGHLKQNTIREKNELML
jgi:hypothetical protein